MMKFTKIEDINIISGELAEVGILEKKVEVQSERPWLMAHESELAVHSQVTENAFRETV